MSAAEKGSGTPMRRTGTGWQASCGWLPPRYCAATATWVRAIEIFAQGLAPPKQSRQWHATWPASSTASSPKGRHGWIAEPNNTSRTVKRAIWPDFRLRLAHVDSASCPPRIKSPEMSQNRSEFLESGWHCDFPEKYAILSVPTTQHRTASVSERPAPGCVAAARGSVLSSWYAQNRIFLREIAM